MFRIDLIVIIIYFTSKNVALPNTLKNKGNFNFEASNEDGFNIHQESYPYNSIVPVEYTSWDEFAHEGLITRKGGDDVEFNIPPNSYQNNSIVPVVRCPAGTFRGSVEYTRGGNRYFKFQSIPYAEPPRRFEPSILKARLEDVYDATTEPPICPQIPDGKTEFAGQEDCLYLSVSRPHKSNCRRELSDGKLLPVLVWIHGGSFLNGNGSFYTGTYLLDECVVLVTINYRFGALGFLTTEDNVIPGNLGLKDQVVALKWTKRNIRYFLGDPSLVTIAGSSAGSSAVSHHVCSPASSGLFARAICMSGAVLAPWSVTEKPRIFARNLARKFNCFDTSSKGIKSCLLRQSAQAIVNAQIAAADFAIRFTPVLEPLNALSPFQNAVPYHLLKTGRINRVPLLTGFVQDEALSVATELLSSATADIVLNVAFSKVAPVELFYSDLNIPTPEVNQISDSIRYFYFKNFPISAKQRQNFVNLLSDRLMIQGTYETVTLISRYVPTYLYMNSYKGGVSDAQLNHGYRIPVISHIDDEQYIFPKFKLWLPGTEQYEFSKDMLELWTNFMRYGRTFGRLTQRVPWDKVNFLDPVYRKVYNLDNPPRIIRNLWRTRTQFWRGLGLYKYEFAELRVPTSKGLRWTNST